ncbi:e1-E2 ATPase domain-containing protein [Sarocladium implicatum]|nr:e1-E2 ATPase domain-containing protein [Sarocladium implicatum]
MSSSQYATSSYLLGNLHCPSCVALIRDLLPETFGDKISWASPNLVTCVVTVEHLDLDTDDLFNAMGKALEDVGFEIHGASTTSHSASLSGSHWDGASRLEAASNSLPDAHEPANTSRPWSRLWPWPAAQTASQTRDQAHFDNCKSCQKAVMLEKQTSSTSIDDEGAGDKTLKSDAIGSGQQQGFSVAVDAVPQSSWQATLSIGGMTCAVCSNTITSELQKHPWISKVAVNLVGNSATVTYADRQRTDDIVEAIEDLGYDAVIDKVTELSATSQSSEGEQKEVEIKIDGMFCPRCPERVGQALDDIQAGPVSILQTPDLKRPILRLKYQPAAPAFTIRNILQAIEGADPALHASVYHPPTLEDRSRAIRAQHQRALMWRLLLSFTIAIPTFIIGIVYMSILPMSNATKQYLEKPWTSGLSRMDVALCVLATPVWLFAADIFHVRAIKEVRTMWKRTSRTPLLQRFYKFGSMNMLISLGTSIAYLSSVIQMIVAAADGHKPEGDHFYFDSVVFLTMFLLAGRVIEAYSKSKTGDAVEKLGQLRPDTANLIEDYQKPTQSTAQVPVDQLEFGDIIMVPNGASPPADGEIVKGDTIFDESSLTGESRPVQKVQGEAVFAGTINKGSPVTVRVTGTSGRSMLDQIVDIVREGQTKRAPIEQIADIMTTYFVPVITLIALLTWVIWLSLGLSGAVDNHATHTTAGAVAFAFRFAIAVFVIACPCGLALAAPTAIFVGGGLAAKYGILVKGGGEAFEKGSKIDCVVFDKTGTLTQGGEPQVTDSKILLDGMRGIITEDGLLSALRAVEESSSHPIAKAIVSFCGSNGKSAELVSADELAGKGLQATCKAGGMTFGIAVGNEPMMSDLDIDLSGIASVLDEWKQAAKSIALVAIKQESESEWTLAAALSISDPIRDEAPAVVKNLQAAGVQVWMLSGDNITTVRAVASLVGISTENVLAEVLPSEKAAKISYLQRTQPASDSKRPRATVAMVGDGINDSPALTTADVGIAIGSGSDVAISSADFVLATSNLNSVPTLLSLSRAVLRRVKFNFGWALVYNMIALPVAAGALYAVKTGDGSHVMLDPVWAALAMALSSISVVVSSLCMRTRLPLIGFRG